MDVALRQRLDGVAHISISQSEQTAQVDFVSRPHAFSAAAFRQAVGEADVEVLRFEVDVCGVVAQDANQRWLTAGADRFLLTAGDASVGSYVCTTGRLDDQSGQPHPVIEGGQVIQ